MDTMPATIQLQFIEYFNPHKESQDFGQHHVNDIIMKEETGLKQRLAFLPTFPQLVIGKAEFRQDFTSEPV